MPPPLPEARSKIMCFRIISGFCCQRGIDSRNWAIIASRVIPLGRSNRTISVIIGRQPFSGAIYHINTALVTFPLTGVEIGHGPGLAVQDLATALLAGAAFDQVIG